MALSYDKAVNDISKAIAEENYEIEALDTLKSIALSGVAKAQFAVGMLYFDGEGLKQDHTKAFYWLRMAAENDFKEAQYVVGTTYLLGETAVQNLSEAEKWLRKSAEQGFAEAQYALGIMYAKVYAKNLRDIGYMQDLLNKENVVERWIRQSAQSNYEEEALKWLRKAAQQNHKDAQKALKELG